jgi:hypothetical protein
MFTNSEQATKNIFVRMTPISSQFTKSKYCFGTAAPVFSELTELNVTGTVFFFYQEPNKNIQPNATSVPGLLSQEE